MEKYEVARLLPKVGDKFRKAPTIVYLRGMTHNATVQECEVVEVNRAHLWYRVRFANGFTECYKVPEDRPARKGGPR